MSLFDSTGGIHDDSLRSVIEDPEFTETVTHYPLVATAGAGGHAEPEFGDGRTVTVQFRSPDAVDFEVGRTGQEDAVEYLVLAMLDAGLDEDDRLVYDNGLVERQYRLVEPRTTTFDGDSFVHWAAEEDMRGEGTGDSGGGDETSDDDPDLYR